jgi:hypothetical protein
LNNAAVGEVFPEFTITERGIMKSR